MGVSSLFLSAATRELSHGGGAVRTPFLRVVGIQVDSMGGGRAASSYTPQEEEVLQRLARDPGT